MTNGEHDDPLMTEIRKAADLIRYICASTDAHPTEAWSKDQLVAMLSEIQSEADKIVSLTGIADLNRHYEKVWPDLTLDRADCPREHHPYTEIEENAGPDRLPCGCPLPVQREAAQH